VPQRTGLSVVIAQSPPADVPVPPPIVVLAGRHRVRPVWRNGLGGLTFEITGPAGRRFARWAPAGNGLDLVLEAAAGAVALGGRVHRGAFRVDPDGHNWPTTDPGATGDVTLR
jgi:hypothetical protein